MKNRPTENTERSPEARDRIKGTLNKLVPRVMGEPLAPRGPRKEPILWSPPEPGSVQISHRITKVPDARF